MGISIESLSWTKDGPDYKIDIHGTTSAAGHEITITITPDAACGDTTVRTYKHTPGTNIWDLKTSDTYDETCKYTVTVNRNGAKQDVKTLEPYADRNSTLQPGGTATASASIGTTAITVSAVAPPNQWVRVELIKRNTAPSNPPPPVFGRFALVQAGGNGSYVVVFEHVEKNASYIIRKIDASDIGIVGVVETYELNAGGALTQTSPTSVAPV